MYNDLHIFFVFSCKMILTRVPEKKSLLQSATSSASAAERHCFAAACTLSTLLFPDRRSAPPHPTAAQLKRPMDPLGPPLRCKKIAFGREIN